MSTVKQLCPAGVNCTQTNDELHKDTYMHICKYGANCRNTNNIIHVGRFIHPQPQFQQMHTFEQPQQQQQQQQHVYVQQPMQTITHFPPINFQVTTPCPSGLSCTLIGIQHHEQSHLHPCRRGLLCQDHENVGHQLTYYHHYPEIDKVTYVQYNQALNLKRGCPHLLSGIQCNFNDLIHTDQYYHVCPNGDQCTYIGHENHTRYFVHQCSAGLSCLQLTNDWHSKYFFHHPILPVLVHPITPTSPPNCLVHPIMPTSPPDCLVLPSITPRTTQTSQKKPENLQICTKGIRCTETNVHLHISSYLHVCESGSNCKKTDDHFHRTHFIHPCRHGEKCRTKDDELHATRFMHPCVNGARCTELANPKHMCRFTHECRDNGGWPEEWQENPIPPSLVQNPKLIHKNLYTLNRKGNEFKNVKKIVIDAIKIKIPKPTIIEIQRNEDAGKWMAYVMKRNDITGQNGGNANEKLLLHGVRNNALASLIDNGFSYQTALPTAPVSRIITC